MSSWLLIRFNLFSQSSWFQCFSHLLSADVAQLNRIAAFMTKSKKSWESISTELSCSWSNNVKHWRSSEIWILKRSDDILCSCLIHQNDLADFYKIQWNMLIRQQMKTIRMMSEIVYKKKIKFFQLIWFFNIFISSIYLLSLLLKHIQNLF